MAKKRKRIKKQVGSDQLISFLSTLCILIPGSVIFVMLIMRLIYQHEVNFVYPELDANNDNVSNVFVITNIEQPMLLTQKQIDVVRVIQENWHDMFRWFLPFYGMRIYRHLIDIAGQLRGVIWAQCDDGTQAAYVMHPRNMDFLDDGGFRFKRGARIAVVHSILNTEDIMLKMQTAGEICRMGDGHSISKINNLFINGNAKLVSKVKEKPSKNHLKKLMIENKSYEPREAEQAPAVRADAIDLAEELDLLGSYEP